MNYSVLSSLVLLNVLFLNVQCLRNKIDLINAHVTTHNYEILCFCEHWMSQFEVESLLINDFEIAFDIRTEEP